MNPQGGPRSNPFGGTQPVRRPQAVTPPWQHTAPTPAPVAAPSAPMMGQGGRSDMMAGGGGGGGPPSAPFAASSINSHPSAPTMHNRVHPPFGGSGGRGGGPVTPPTGVYGPMTGAWANTNQNPTPHNTSPFPSTSPPNPQNTSPNIWNPSPFSAPSGQPQPQGAGKGGAFPHPQGMQDAMKAVGLSDTQQAVAGLVVNRLTETMGVSSATMSSWVPSYVLQIRKYFNVSHRYVIRKLLFIIFPFLGKKMWNTKKDDDGWGGGGNGGGAFNSDPNSPQTETSTSPSSPELEDVVTADLYIPLMAYITYILTYGFAKGTLADFHPELLGSCASFAGVLVFLEICAVKSAFFLSGEKRNIPKWGELLALSGYKFVGLVVTALVGLLVCFLLSSLWILPWVAMVYFACAAAFVACRALELPQNGSSDDQWGGGHRSGQSKRQLIAWGLAVAQLPICYFLTPSFTMKTSA